MLNLANDSAGDSASSPWLIEVAGFDPAREREVEALFALSNGYVGTRASLPEGHISADPGSFVAGVYDRLDEPGAVPDLVRIPDWLSVRVIVAGETLSLDRGELFEHQRVLDLRHGTMTRFWRHRDPNGRLTRLRFLHAVSLADRHALIQRIEVTPENYSAQITMELRVDASPALQGEMAEGFAPGANPGRQSAADLHYLGPQGSEGVLTLRTGDSGIAIATALGSVFTRPPKSAQYSAHASQECLSQRWSWDARMGSTYRFDKLVSIQTSLETQQPEVTACAHVQSLTALGATDALTDHRRSWRRHWQEADVVLAGVPELQRAARFAAFQLIGAADANNERVSIGARGLTGAAYKGHVFWDTDIFMLPFFIFTDPPAARAMLMYRFNTLSGARRKAARLGYRGALYAWESAGTGDEAAPAEVRTAGGRIIPILTGAEEQHISADVAYAVWQYWQATGDDAFLLGPGLEILVETARFWESRAESGADGRYHIRGVLGPDEYHDHVDDNAYTNLLAQWNLRTAATAVERQGSGVQSTTDWLPPRDAELLRWRQVAEGLVNGLDPSTGLVEQFSGYHDLKDIDLTALAPRSVPIDLLLGQARVRQSKVIKQADVLMALYLLWDGFSSDTLRTNLGYYEPRTAHGSSLSPGIHAAFTARLGELELAAPYLQQTATIDLEDEMGNADGGVHLGALGSLWQAIVCGFIGLRISGSGVVIEPRLPPGCDRLSCAFHWRGRKLRVTVRARTASSELRLISGSPLWVSREGSRRLLSIGARLTSPGLGRRLDLQEEICDGD